jgi:hypothetical protein
MSQNWGAYNASHSTAGASPLATIPVALNFHVSGDTAAPVHGRHGRAPQTQTLQRQ